MRIKICGLFREEDVGYVNRAGVDYAGFVFADSRRQVSHALAMHLRRRLDEGIVPVGVFVNAFCEDIVALYRDGIIGMAQLHGTEDDGYIARLKEASLDGGNLEPIPVIKTILGDELSKGTGPVSRADYYLVDSGSGSGKTFDWNLLESRHFSKPWFLAGGINVDNIERATTFNPFAIDVSSGAETDGVKDPEKILRLATMAKKGNAL